MKKIILKLLCVISFSLHANNQWMYKNSFPNYYTVLGVKENASQDELRKAYRKQSLKTHPDKAGGSKEAFILVKEAYDNLIDPQQRNQYNKALNNHLSEGWEILSDDDWDSVPR